MSMTTETPTPPVEPTTADILGKVVEAIDAVQDAEATVVAEGAKLAAHLNDPNAHGAGVAANVVAAVNAHDRDATAHGLDTLHEDFSKHADDDTAHGLDTLSGTLREEAANALATHKADAEAHGLDALSMDLNAKIADAVAAVDVLRGETDVATLVRTDDSRLTDARAPLAHAGEHRHGGSDEIGLETPEAFGIPKARADGFLAPGWFAGGSETQSGALRLSTDREFASGVAGVAAQPSQVIEYTRNIVERLPGVAAPVVTAPQAGAEVPRRIHVVCAPFESVNVTTPDVHVGTQFIFSDADAGAVLHDSGVLSEPAPPTEYTSPRLPERMRVDITATYYGENLGPSLPSLPLRVTTLRQGVQPPAVLAPAEGAVNVAARPTVTLEEFAVYGGTDTPSGTRLALYRKTDLSGAPVFDTGWIAYTTSIAVTVTLPELTTLHAVAWHRGTDFGESLPGPARTFTTADQGVSAPGISSPVQGQMDVPLRPVLELAAFSPFGGTDTAVKTMVQIATDSTFNNVIWQYDGPYAVSVAVDADLPLLTTLVARARHTGQLFGASEWGEVRTFTTLNQLVLPPVFRQPVSGAVKVGLLPVLETDPMAFAGGNDTPAFVQFRIWNNAEKTGNPVYDSGKIAYTATHAVAAPLALLTPYWVEAKHWGTAFGESDWSGLAAFTTRDNQPPDMQGFAHTVPSTVVIGGTHMVRFSGATDPDGDGITYSIDPGSSGMMFSKTSGIAPNEDVRMTVPDISENSRNVSFTVYASDGIASSSRSISATILKQTAWEFTGNATLAIPNGQYCVEVWGGRGGDARKYNGGPITANGGNGGYAKKTIWLAQGSYPVSVGGNGGWVWDQSRCGMDQNATTRGGSGGTTSFGSIVSATGGSGASVAWVYDRYENGYSWYCEKASNGSSGSGVGGDLNQSGVSGQGKCRVTYLGV